MIRFVVYDCHLGVCDYVYTRVKDVFRQHLPSNRKQELCRVQTIVYNKSCRIDGP